jgi:hypothetical protein
MEMALEGLLELLVAGHRRPEFSEMGWGLASS